jgi:hypothetical protein
MTKSKKKAIQGIIKKWVILKYIIVAIFISLSELLSPDGGDRSFFP